MFLNENKINCESFVDVVGDDDGKTLQTFPNEYSIDPLIFDSN